MLSQMKTLLLLSLLIMSFTKEGISQVVSVSYSYDELNRLKKATYSNGSEITYAYDSAGNRTSVMVTGVEFKADVTPRPTGKRNGTVNLSDWVKTGLFFVGLEKPDANELRRADSAPRTATKNGDGIITISDWVQAGRYFVGLDDLTAVACPNVNCAITTAAITQQMAADTSQQETTAEKDSYKVVSQVVRAISVITQRGQMAEIRIELDARGNENALSFSLNYDPTALSFAEAVLGSDAENAQLLVMPNQSLMGRVGIALALPPGKVLAVGTRTLVILRFSTLIDAPATTSRVSFSDEPTSRGLANVTADSLTASFVGANVTVNADPNPQPTLSSVTPVTAMVGSGGFTLSVSGSNFVSGASVQWNGATRPTRFVSATQLSVDIPAVDVATPGAASIAVSNPSPGGGLSSAMSFIINAASTANRSVRVVPVSTTPGKTVSVPVELNSQGDENALSFSVTVDPTVLSNLRVSAGGDAIGAALSVNDQQARSGRYGVALALQPGQRFAAGVRQLLNMTFTVAAEAQANTTAIEVADQPLSRDVVDASANILFATWAPGAVLINRQVMSVSAASFNGENLAMESIVSAFGGNLATESKAAVTKPLPTNLAGTTVKVKDSAGNERLAPLFYVSPNQVNYQMPPGTSPGTATVTITNGSGVISTGMTLVESAVPGVFSAEASGSGWAAAVALRVKADGTQSYEPIVQFDPAQNKLVSRPIDLGAASDQVYLVLFGTGIRYRNSLSTVTSKINQTNSQVVFAGQQGDLVGVDQVNVLLSRSLAGSGEVEIRLMVDGKPANVVKINIK